MALESAAFRVGGLVSGLSTDSIISQLMDIERKPIDLLNTNKDTMTERLTAWRNFNTRVQGLSVQTERMSDTDNFKAGKATSSNTDLLTVAAGDDVADGSYQVTVKQLAQNHQIASQAYTSYDTKLGTGTINITIGSATYKPIEIKEGSNTILAVRDAINASNAPVTASILNAGTLENPQYKLTIASKVNGKDGELTVGMDLTGGTTPAFTDIQAAQDAKIILGTGAGAVEINRSSNSIGGVIAGVTLTLVSADETKPVTITTSPDKEAVKTNIKNFMTQFNYIVDFFNAQFDYDETTGKGGTLFSDTNLYLAKEQMYGMITELSSNGGKYSSLSQIGIETDATGKLAIKDQTLFDEAVDNNIDDLSKLFAGEKGIGTKLNDYMDTINDPTNGILQSMDTFYTGEITAIEDKIEIKEEYLTRVETRYYKTYSNLETTLAKLKAQGSYLDQQITAMNNTNSSGSSSG